VKAKGEIKVNENMKDCSGEECDSELGSIIEIALSVFERHCPPESSKGTGSVE
jgi:hypothetical protein